MRWCDAFGNEQDAVTMMVLRVEEESSSTRIVTGTALFERAMLGFAKVEVHFVSSLKGLISLSLHQARTLLE